MKKRIAIITQPLISNYGGLLQAFALQKVLKKVGHEPVTIGRRMNEYSNVKIFFLLLKKKIFKHHKNLILTASQKQYTGKYSREFINKYIDITEFVVKEEQMKSFFLKENFDSVVVGSDQVWRPKYSPNIYNDFFDFIESNDQINKISYAASFGTDEWEFTEEETKVCKKLIHKFNAISVREEAGVKMCKEYFDVEAKQVLDPTLLLDKEDYIELFYKKTSKINTKKLYTYVLDRGEEKNKIIDKISGLKNIEEYYFQSDYSINEVNNKKDLEALVYPPVEDWIKGFHDASFVVTDSFHGTVFSIIFNKNFVVIGNKERGLSRFQSLLKLFDLEKRLVFEEKDVTDELLAESIDFERVNKLREELQKISISFLKNNV